MRGRKEHGEEGSGTTKELSHARREVTAVLSGADKETNLVHTKEGREQGSVPSREKSALLKLPNLLPL